MEQNKLAVLETLYKAQIEMANAYELCVDEGLKKTIMKDYENLENIVSGLEKELLIFGEE